MSALESQRFVSWTSDNGLEGIFLGILLLALVLIISFKYIKSSKVVRNFIDD